MEMVHVNGPLHMPSPSLDCDCDRDGDVDSMCKWAVTCTVSTPCPSPSPSPSKFIIVPMVTDRLMDRLGSESILSISVNLTVTGMKTVRVNGPFDVLSRMNRMDLNTYLYAPKDDYKHRLKWRDLYNEEEAGKASFKLNESEHEGIFFFDIFCYSM